MVWDLQRANPFGAAAGRRATVCRDRRRHHRELCSDGATCRSPAHVGDVSYRDHDNSFDAVITDPPYYDNISYADLSDFFYVWLKRSVGFLFEEHFAGELTPKKREAIVAPRIATAATSPRRERSTSRRWLQPFAEAHRVLKPGAPLVCVYAHKTTLGWAALVEALRQARFTITEAWPLDTEMPERARGQKALPSLPRSSSSPAAAMTTLTGSYHDVLAELDGVIDERLERLDGRWASPAPTW